MKRKQKYISLVHTLKNLRLQAIESIPYCYQLTDGLNNPQDLFNYLKSITSYEPDPPGIELIHTAKSLFEKNYHGISGAGDCDDLTVLSFASLYCLGIKKQYITLSGNQENVPTHIFISFIESGNLINFDLTQTFYNVTRKYNFCQYLPIKI